MDQAKKAIGSEIQKITDMVNHRHRRAPPLLAKP
jgi:hypothetical protein